MGSILPDWYSYKAVIVSGLLFGIIIWAAQFASDQCLIMTGFVSLRSTLFLIMILFVTPVLLVIAGAVSEVMRNREPGTRWAPGIYYLTGFLGMSSAFFLSRVVSSANQYLPYMAPGILPRVSYMTGDIIMHLPELLVISTIFAFFSLAGGYGMHRKLKRE